MMKWSRGSAELPSDKTFLVIRHDLQSSPDSEKEASSSSCCETWPKMRKRRARQSSRPPSTSETESCSPGEEEPRPATASLEAPLVLDPRLIDKLDMSLLSKESLTDSLTRIAMSLATTPLDNSPVKSSEDYRPAKSIGNLNNGNNNNNNAVQLARPRARLAMSAPRKSSLDSSATNSESDCRTTSSNAAASSPEVKKLDDNNNKNRDRERSNGSPLTQLSPVRSRSSRNTVNSSDVALFTGASHASTSRIRKSMLPVEPCRACGRAAQPERFHSHPKSPPDSPGTESSSWRHRIPTRLEMLQRQLPGTVLDRQAASPLSDQPLSTASTSGDEKTLSEQETAAAAAAAAAAGGGGGGSGFVRKERKVNSATTNPNKPNEDKSATSIGKRRPRTVTCYICGREFGTASFPIHEPKCLQKWHRENKALPSSQRRNIPQRPNVPIDHEDWNTAAWEHSQALLIPCSKCKRTFLPDRLAIHERNCRVPNKAGILNTNYNRAQALSRSELQRMDISNLLSRRNNEAAATADDQSSVAAQMSARIKPSRIAVRTEAARKIA